MSPSEKRSLRIAWYGLTTFGWPLTEDVHGRPYHLSANDDARMFPQVNDCIRSVTPEPALQLALRAQQ